MIEKIITFIEIIILIVYGLYNYIKKARKMTGSTGILLLQMLEMRLDNIVFRLGFATTMPESRQLVNHGHILVNGQSVTIASFQCKKGDVITVKPKSKTLVESIHHPILFPSLTRLLKEEQMHQTLICRSCDILRPYESSVLKKHLPTNQMD